MNELSLLPNQQLRSRLKNIDPLLESVYLGAIYTFNESQNPDRIAQCAHSIRELTIILFRSEIEETTNKIKDTLVNKIQKKINLYDNLPPIYLKNYSKFNKKIHAYFLKIAHHGSSPTIEEFRKKITEYEQILLEILEDYFECFSYVKKVISINKPLLEDIPKLISKLKFISLIRYFFNKISKDWLQTLKRNEFFKHPPGLNTEGYFTPWFESQYLVRVSNSLEVNPEIFYEILKECKISRDIKKRNYHVIQDFLHIALNTDFRTCKKIVDFLINNQLLNHEAVEGINITALLITIFKKYLDNDQFPDIIARHILEIKTVKKTYGRKRKKDDLINEYNAFIFNPLAYTKPEEFTEFINKLKEVYESSPNCSTPLIELIFNIILNLIDNYLIIQRFSNRLENPLFLFETKIVSNIPLFNMQKYELESMTHEFPEIGITLYSLLQLMISNSLQKSDDLVEFVRKDIYSRIKYVPLKKLFLNICLIKPQLFEKEINKLLFQCIEDVDVNYEYYNLAKKSLPSLEEDIKFKYVNKAIEIKENLDLSELGNDYFIPNMIKFFNLYDPIVEFLPEEEAKFYNNCQMKYGNLALNGYTGKSTIRHTTEEMPDLEYGELIEMLKVDRMNKINEIEIIKIKYNIEKHLSAFCKSLKNLKTLNSTYYSLIFEELVYHFQQGKIKLSVIFSFIEQYNQTNNSNEYVSRLIIGFLHRTLNPKNVNQKSGKKIHQLVKDIKISENGSIKGDIDTISIENFSRSTSFVYWTLILKICNFLYMDSIKTNPFKEMIAENLAISDDKNRTISLAVLAYLDTLLNIDEKLVMNNIHKLLPNYQETDKNTYFRSWYLLFATNGFSDRLMKIIIEKFLSHLSNLREINIKNNHEHYRHLIDVITGSYMHGDQNSRILVDSLLQNFPESQKYNFVKRIALVLKDSNRDGISLDLSILQDLINDPRIQDCGEFYTWIKYSPFEKEYTLNLLLKLLKSTKIDISKRFYYLLLDDIIYELKDYIIVNEANVLNAIFLILQKLMQKQLYINRTKVYQSLESIKRTVKNSSRFNGIVQRLLIAGYDEFITLKI